MAALLAVVLVAGGVIGGLIGSAWPEHGRATTSGDVRAWATFVVLVLGFSVAAYELNLQRIQFVRQAARQEASDDLLERQRREMTQTEQARLREQAERISILWEVTMGSAQTLARVLNQSRRPITKVAAGVTVPLPDGGMETHGALGWTSSTDNPPSSATLLVPGALPVVTPGASVSCRLPHGGDREGARLVVRFYDDAERRWQLDDYMHLEPAPDDGW
jgi:hypothetical protein